MGSLTHRDRPAVRGLPPLFFLAFLITAGLLEYGLGGDPPVGPAWVRRSIALLVFLFSGYLALHSWVILIKTGTNVDPRKPTLQIVERGPFRISRNPMYLSLVLVLVALSILQPSIWFLLSGVGLWFVLDRTAVVPEEAYLEEKFGNLYCGYKSRVRRWI